MKRLLLALVMGALCPLIATASHIHSTKAEQTLEQMLGTSGMIEIFTMKGRAAPALSPASQGRIYFDSTSMNFQVSENGGAYETLLTGAGGVLGTGSGGTGTSTTFTQGSIVFAGASGVYSQDNANLFWDDSTNRLGIATAAAPSTTLHVGGQTLIKSTNSSAISIEDASGNPYLRVDSSGPDGSNATVRAGILTYTIVTDSAANYEEGVLKSEPTWSPSSNSTTSFSAVGANPDTAGSNNLGRLIGVRARPSHSGTGTLTNLNGIMGVAISNVGAGPVTTMRGLNFTVSNASSNTVTDMNGVEVDVNKFTSGAVTNAKGLYIRSGFSGVTGTKHSLYLEDTSAHSYFNHRIGISTTAPTNSLSFGGNTARIAWMERHTTANTAGNTLTLQSGGATSAATNKAGGQLILAPGVNTGTGRSTVSIKGYTVATGSGTTDGTQVDRQVIGGFKALTDGADAALVNVTVASNTVASGVIRYAVEVFNGTDLQVEEGQAFYHVTNKAGTIANNEVNQTFQQALTSGTLLVDWTITAADPAVVTINANSSLTPSAGYPRITYTIESFSQQAISIQ